METVVGIMKKVAEQETRRLYTTELGVVTAVFPHAGEDDADNYQCSVKLKNKKQPDGSDFELRQVPIATPYVGLVCIPNMGDLVLVNFIGGDINAPVITGRLYNDEDRPPVNESDEFLLQHKLAEGGSLKLDKDGKITLTSKNEENVLTVEDDKISLENEKFSIVIDFAGEIISITSDKDLELVASGKFSVDAKEVEIKSGGAVKISSGGAVNVEASGAMTLKGSTIDLN